MFVGLALLVLLVDAADGRHDYLHGMQKRGHMIVEEVSHFAKTIVESVSRDGVAPLGVPTIGVVPTVEAPSPAVDGNQSALIRESRSRLAGSQMVGLIGGTMDGPAPHGASDLAGTRTGETESTGIGQELHGIEDGELGWNGRVVIWRESWNEFTNSPFLGTGLGVSASGRYAHNALLEVAAAGILAVLGWMGMWAWTLHTLGRRAQLSAQWRFLFGASIAFLVFSGFLSTIYDPLGAVIVGCTVAAALPVDGSVLKSAP